MPPAFHILQPNWYIYPPTVDNGIFNNHIIDVVQKEKDIDLDDYLAEMINQEFDTLVEDGSLEYSTRWIIKFYKDCVQGREQEVLASINQAAAKKQSLGNMIIPAPRNVTQESDDDDDCDDDDDEMDDDSW